MKPVTNVDSSTPLWAVNALTFLASVGTGVVWNGVSFVAKHDYKFTQQQTLLLYALLGVVYVIGAMSTGRVLRAVEQALSPRGALAFILALEAAACISLKFVHAGWMLTLVSCVISLLSSWLWPIVESYLTAGRHGVQMRSAIGWWNLCWTSATAAALVMMIPAMKDPPLTITLGNLAVRLEPRLAIVALGALHAVALVPLLRFGRWPGAHDEALSKASVQPEYPLLLHAVRMLLPLSYVMNSAMSPLLPYLFDRIELAQHWETVVASMWMWVRILAMAIMWQLGFWHGRWGTLLLGAILLALGFAIVVTTFSLPLMIVGLGVFGCGMGTVYYAALYYAMSVGRAEVDAGGTHEALIGLGYSLGPAAGLTGHFATEQARNAGVDVWPGGGIVAVVWLLAAAAAIGAVRPYLAAKRTRNLPRDNPK
jgi:MFS family permease